MLNFSGVSFTDKRTISLAVLLLLTLSVATTILFLRRPQTIVTRADVIAIPSITSGHFIGGFSAGSTAGKQPGSEVGAIADLAADGGQFDVLYGTALTDYPSIHQLLTQYHIGAIDAFPASELSKYDSGSESQQAALTTIANHIKLLESIPVYSTIIKSFYILDDQKNSDDNGYLRNSLQQVHALVQQYAPGIPTICAFGPFFGYTNGTGVWNPSTLYADFSPSGCDMVAIYAYASPNLSSKNPGDYDWSMHTLMPQVLQALASYGRTSAQPLIGIPVAFGGWSGGLNWVIPSAAGIQEQSLAFCQTYGATGLLYYTWYDSTTPNNAQNTPTIKQGVQEGVQSCRGVWPQPTPTPTPVPPTPTPIPFIPPSITNMTTGCNGGMSYTNASWTHETGATAYTLDWWFTDPITKQYNECQRTMDSDTYNISEQDNGSSLTIKLLGSSCYKQGVSMGAAVKVEAPGITDYGTPHPPLTTASCSNPPLSNTPTLLQPSHAQLSQSPPMLSASPQPSHPSYNGVSSGNLAVTSTQTLFGDINGDGRIDILDFNILRNCFGTRADTPSCPDKVGADLDHDGVVDGVDYNLWLRAFLGVN